MRTTCWAVVATLLACAAVAAAGFEANVTITNTTGEDKTNWPVVLTVYKVFGGNLPIERINPAGFHVFDAAGRELPHMLRRLPPDISPGNDQIVFVVPALPAGKSMKLRVTNDQRRGRIARIDLVGSGHNLLTGRGFQKIVDGAPEGFTASAKGGAKLAIDRRGRRRRRGCLRIDLPVGSSATLRSARPIQFRKDGRYHFSVWARCANLAYNGFRFAGGGSVKFDPPALRGRGELRLRGDREWFCYQFDPGGSDRWGVPDEASRAQAEQVRTRGRNAPAAIWAKTGGKAHLVITFAQQSQPFLKGDKSGTVWLDEAMLFEQPMVTVDRRKPLTAAAVDDVLVYARPVNSPRWGPFAHEAAKKIDAYAMRGQRQQVRFGVYGLSREGLGKVAVSVSPLAGPAGRLGPERLDLELNNHYIEPYRPQQLKPGRWAEYLLAFDVPRDAAPGRYTGSITITTGQRKASRKLPVALEVLPVKVPNMDGYWVGPVYNIGLGLDRDDAFYRCYGKVRFTNIMLFDYLIAQMKGDKIDYAAADRQVEKIVKLAHVDAGIGLYREPNMSEDEPRKWYQIAAGKPDYQGKYKIGTDAKFKAGYQKLAREAHAHAKKAGWPRLIYMVSDEPGNRRDKVPSMGWLSEAIPEAITCADVQFADMLATWQWYNLPILDDPADWSGPLVYEFIKARKKHFGICGTPWSVETARYQPGYMLPAIGACYWHFWHTGGPFAAREGRVDRRFVLPLMSAGVNDLRYYVALKQRIARQPQSAVAIEAGQYLRTILSVIPGDHDRVDRRYFMPHNGVPRTWGYDRFYDDWRAKMKDYILRLDAEAAAGRPKAGKPGRAPPLPKPTGEVVNVRTPQELARALDAARPGQTIMLADGLYDTSNLGFLHLARDNLTLRGASGDPTKVILKGKGFKRHDVKEEMIKVVGKGVTIADLTIRDVGANGIKLAGGNHNLLVHNVHFIDICERAIKGPHAPESRNGIVRYCLFEQVTPITDDIPNLVFRGDYIAGMDMMHISGWRIHDNTFKNIRGKNREGRAGVFIWQGSHDNVIERNTFIGCDRGVTYGMAGETTSGIIRNNFFRGGAAQAIDLGRATDVKIYNNTIYHMSEIVDKRTISLRDCSGVDVRNNLVFSTVKSVSGKGYTAANNLWFTDASLAEKFFVDPAAGDLHLKPTAAEAIDRGVALPEVTADWDGERRAGKPDIGADEVAPAAPAGTAAEKKPPVEAILKIAAKAPPLPKPTGKVVRVSDAAGLREAVASAKPGTTILLADGRYKVDRLRIRQDRLSLRGASGDRDKVILDGGGKLTRIVIIESGKDLLFADLTVANSKEYGIFFYGDAGAHRLRVYNVKFLNCLTRGLKGTDAAKVRDSWTHKHPPEKERQLRPIGGQVRYCLFINDRASPRLDLYHGDYIGGIDIMSAKDWTVADNVFVNIRGQRGGGRGAIFFWVNAENVVAERNLIINCDRSICFGNPSGKRWHMTGGVIRNNFIVAGKSEAIEVCQARNTLVANNTLWCRQQKQRAVRFVGPVPGCRLVNNLIRGTVEAPAESKGEGNIVGELKGWFRRPEVGDLHLTTNAAEAIDRGVALPKVTADWDGERRTGKPDIGADESPAAATGVNRAPQ